MRAATILVLLGACGGGASNDLGYEAPLQVPGAQFRPGPFPAPTGGPNVDGEPIPTTTQIVIGNFEQTVNASVGANAHGAIIGVVGADGNWIVTAGPPVFNMPDDGTISTRFGLGDAAQPGPFVLQLAAVDGAGKIGSAASVELVADPVPLPAADAGATLLVGLVWDNAADLDLHVVDPEGHEAWTGQPSTFPYPDPMTCNCVPVVQAADDMWDAGVLDRDDNKDCKFADATPSEHVVWHALPPTGKYTVRVDARSMCGAPDVAWYVEVLDTNQQLLAAARGVSTPDDVTYAAHGAGAGQTALTFSR
jgi:hypothetical protein